MSLFGTLGSLAGAFFGGPIGGAIGGALGGSVDSGNSARTAQEAQNSTNQFNAEQSQISRDWSSNQAEAARTFSANEAAKNREFQERTSGQSYQRAVKDMQAAGLNPMLAYSQGGASQPSGGQATSSAPGGATASSQNVHPGSVSSAAQASQAAAQVEVARAQARNIDADTRLKEAQIPFTSQQSATSASQAELNRTTQNNIDAITTKVGAEVMQLKALTINTKQNTETQAAQEALYRFTHAKVVAETKNLDLSSNQILAMTAKIIAETQNVKLHTPRLVNEALAEDDPWKKTVSPYLRDIEAIGGTASSLFRAVTPWGKLPDKTIHHKHTYPTK